MKRIHDNLTENNTGGGSLKIVTSWNIRVFLNKQHRDFFGPVVYDSQLVEQLMGWKTSWNNITEYFR